MTHPTTRLLRLIVFVTIFVVLAPSAASARRSLARIPAKSPNQVRQLLERNIEILSISRDNIIDALVDEKQKQYLLSQGYPVSIVPAFDLERSAAQLDTDLGLYHTFAEMESLLTAWETEFPSICDVFTIGSSIEARPIYAIKISDNVAIDETGEAEVLYMGNHHARELMSVEIPLLFAEHLLVSYGTDPVVTAHVDGKEIFFVPMLNPDGHIYVQNNHSGFWGNWWRKNRRPNPDGSFGVDLNRNYGYAWGWDDIGSDPTMSSVLYRGPYAFSEPETQAIRDFANAREFTMWLSYHSYGELLIYPWGYIKENTPDHRVFKRLGELLTAANGYRAGNSASDILYVVNGDSDDWGYGEQTTKNEIFAFTPEVNSYAQGGFGPPDSLIAPTYALNFEMNMRVLEYSDNPYGVVGPLRPDMYAVADPYHPIHTVSWSPSEPADRNPAVQYEVERCLNPSFVQDECEGYSGDWLFDGFTTSSTAYTGSGGYYSGMGDNMENAITTTRPYRVEAASDTLAFWTSYAIETNWDYAYVEISQDFGETWTTVAGNITTPYDPNGNNRGDGITGTVPGWVQAIFPLTAYLGEEILLRISYVTDASVMEHGIDVDVISPVPTCQSVDVVASGVTDTTLLVVPDVIGEYRYRVQGYDAESDASGWSGSAGILVTSVTDASSGPAYPSRLGTNYPNPFNPSTTIPYSVGGPARGGGPRPVTLRIYDITGRLVATLVDEGKTPGIYEAVWSGTAVASGIYFCRLTVAGETVSTRKLVLLK
jgi:hypothetical protein